MSSIIEFFVAPDDAAALGVAPNGPSGTFESATYGNFDALSTLEEWEWILTNHSVGEIAASTAEVIAGGDGSAVVMAAPGDLVTALAAADDRILTSTAERWVELRDEEGETIDRELAREIIGEVATLAVNAARTGKSLYCWIG